MYVCSTTIGIIISITLSCFNALKYVSQSSKQFAVIRALLPFGTVFNHVQYAPTNNMQRDLTGKCGCMSIVVAGAI